ncbi:MAG: hypothetical protein WDN75_06605 [Bacteroidota bacterium]
MLNDQDHCMSLKKFRCSAILDFLFFNNPQALISGTIPRMVNRISAGEKNELNGDSLRIERGNPNKDPSGEINSAPPP